MVCCGETCPFALGLREGRLLGVAERDGINASLIVVVDSGMEIAYSSFLVWKLFHDLLDGTP